MPKAKNSDEGELTVTTFRVTRGQLYWLRDQANQRAKVRGRGRSDMSGVVRELITKAMGRSALAAGEGGAAGRGQGRSARR